MRPSADADLLHRLAKLGSELGFSTPLPGALIFSFWARYRQPRQARRSYQRIFATLPIYSCPPPTGMVKNDGQIMRWVENPFLCPVSDTNATRKACDDQPGGYRLAAKLRASRTHFLMVRRSAILRPVHTLTSFHHQPEAQHPFSYPQAAGRLPIFGLLASLLACSRHVRFLPDSDRKADMPDVRSVPGAEVSSRLRLGDLGPNGGNRQGWETPT
jgi:hypothetical protein